MGNLPKVKEFCNGGLSDNEIERLSKMLDEIEWYAYRPYKHISGAFSEMTVFDYDDEIIDCELVFGVQSDCQDTVHTEIWKIDRKTMKPID